MKIIFIGDIMGRSGRDALEKYIPVIRDKLAPDVFIVNGENAAHGKGITKKITEQFLSWGVHCVTTGNHIWDQREILHSIDTLPQLIRPMNFPPGTPGKGHYLHTLQDGRKILVMNFMGRIFMDPMDDPFAVCRDMLSEYRLGKNVDAIFVDLHAEITSEKMAFARYFDGQVSAVVGTHTHVPTADAHVLKSGTAFQTDAGMTGDYDSVIGVKEDVPIQRFVKKIMLDRMSPADGEATVCGAFIETDDKTGKATRIKSFKLGGVLGEETLFS